MEILDLLLSYLEDAAVKAAFLSLFGAAAIAGWKAWAVKVIVKLFFNQLVEPITELAYRKGMLVYDKKKGKILVKKLNEATDESDWDTTVDKL